MSKLDRLLEKMDLETRGGDCDVDRALFHLLARFRSDLPELDERFHKSFRQIDVTDSYHTDAAIWCLLHQSHLFWRLFEEVQCGSDTEGSSG